jgi:hemoglobin/transferrin/lactoferrin receptor protein
MTSTDLLGTLNIYDINIRGLGRSRVQIRQDGVRMNFLSEHMGRLFVDPAMVEEVEVLRGAGSSLYGSDALGGVVNIKTRDPRQMLKNDEKFGINTHWDYASVNRRLKETMSIFGRPTPQWTYLLSANYWQTGKDIALGDGTRLENSAQEGKQGLSKIFFTPKESLVFSFIHDTFMDTATVPGNPSRLLAPDNFLRDRSTDKELFRLALEQKDDNMLLENFMAALAYQTTEVRHERLTESQQIDDFDANTLSVDINNSNQLESFEKAHRLTYGGEYYKDINHGNRVTSSGTNNINSYPNGVFEGKGLYIQDELSLIEDRIDLIPGIRWDSFRSSAAGNPDNEAIHVSPKLGLVGKIHDQLSVFSSYGAGFRAPRLFELYQTGSHFPGNSFIVNPTLSAEKSRNAEVGLRGQVGRARFETAIFRTDAKDFIETVVGATTTSSLNLNDVRIVGWETMLVFPLIAGWDVSLASSMLRGKEIHTGEHLTSISPDNISSRIHYTNKAKTLDAALLGRMLAAQERPVSTDFHTSGFTTWDLKTSWHLPFLQHSRLGLGIENIFDNDYREHLSTIRAPGRNYCVNLSKEFRW